MLEHHVLRRMNDGGRCIMSKVEPARGIAKAGDTRSRNSHSFPGFPLEAGPVLSCEPYVLMCIFMIHFWWTCLSTCRHYYACALNKFRLFPRPGGATKTAFVAVGLSLSLRVPGMSSSFVGEFITFPNNLTMQPFRHIP